MIDPHVQELISRSSSSTFVTLLATWSEGSLPAFGTGSDDFARRKDLFLDALRQMKRDLLTSASEFLQVDVVSFSSSPSAAITMQAATWRKLLDDNPRYREDRSFVLTLDRSLELVGSSAG